MIFYWGYEISVMKISISLACDSREKNDSYLSRKVSEYNALGKINQILSSLL